jgi:putative endonuclease
MAFYAYMLECSDGSLYVGHTDDLAARLSAHRSRRYAGYTAKRLPVRLIFSEAFNTRDEAFAAERQIKGWSRAKKLALARSEWGLIVQLASIRSDDRRAAGD